MNFNSPLTKHNFLLYAAKHYQNPQCMGTNEFNSDMKRFMYIKRLLKKYQRGQEVDNRLLLNHFVILYNIFAVKPLNRMLYFYCDIDTYNIVYSILDFLNIVSQNLPEVNGIDIKIDEKMAKYLKNLECM